MPLVQFGHQQSGTLLHPTLLWHVGHIGLLHSIFLKVGQLTENEPLTTEDTTSC